MYFPTVTPILPISSTRRSREARRAAEIDASNRVTTRSTRRVLVECVLLVFLGTPFYAWSWHVTDPEMAAVWTALGSAITFAGPFFRWLLHHTRTSETFN